MLPTTITKKLTDSTVLIACLLLLPLCAITSCEQKKVPQTREEKIKAQFSSWDGSHLAFTKMIKEKMNDPDSYEHVATEYEIRENYVLVKTTFRGNNAFGAKMLNELYAQVTTNGDIMETADEDIWLKRDIRREVQEREDRFLEQLDSSNKK